MKSFIIKKINYINQVLESQHINKNLLKNINLLVKVIVLRNKIIKNLLKILKKKDNKWLLWVKEKIVNKTQLLWTFHDYHHYKDQINVHKVKTLDWVLLQLWKGKMSTLRLKSYKRKCNTMNRWKNSYI